MPIVNFDVWLYNQNIYLQNENWMDKGEFAKN